MSTTPSYLTEDGWVRARVRDRPPPSEGDPVVFVDIETDFPRGDRQGQTCHALTAHQQREDRLSLMNETAQTDRAHGPGFAIPVLIDGTQT